MIGGIIKYEGLYEVIKPRYTPLNNYYYLNILLTTTTTTHGLVGHGEENFTIKCGVIVIGSSPTTIKQ